MSRPLSDSPGVGPTDEVGEKPLDSPGSATRQQLDSESAKHFHHDETLSDTSSAHLDGELDIPTRYRVGAFLLVVLFSTGSNYAEGVISPLKTRLRKELKITNAQFGALASATAIVNSVLPIIGGIGMDYWGATYAAVIASTLVVVGQLVACFSATTNKYGLLIGGHIVMGFGSTILEGTQNKLFAHWFHGSWLAFVIGADIAWGRIVSIVIPATAVPLANVSEWWGWALWVPFFVCCLSTAATVAYWLFERKVPRKYRPVLGRHAKAKEGEARKIQWNLLRVLPKFFWVLCSTQVLQNATVSVYSSNLADMQVVTRGTKELAAGYNSSLQGVIPIVLTPLAGLFFDKVGWRCIFISWTAALYVVVFALIGLTTVHPLAPILISSFALSTNAITFNACIPVLVGTQHLMGTAFGVWRAFQNCNTLILEVAAGAIQDRSGGSYNGVIYLLIAIKSVEVCIGPIYDYLDGRWLGHSLRMPEKRRTEFRREVVVAGMQYEGWRISKKVRRGVLCQLGAMIVTGWTLYIVYSLGT